MPPSPIPRTGSPDCTLAALREGYLFIPARCRRYGSDAFRTRLMLTPVVCMSGAEAAELFYGGRRFSRRNAMPVTVLKLLQDRGSVQLLEDAAHHGRKQMFLTLAAPAAAERLAACMADEWRRRLPRPSFSAGRLGAPRPLRHVPRPAGLGRT